MPTVSELPEKISSVSATFQHLKNRRIVGYEIAQIRDEQSEKWESWMDLPVFLVFEPRVAVSISWSQFDDLTVENGRFIPFPLTGFHVRWVSEGIEALDKCIGRELQQVSFGLGQMSIGHYEPDIWTRLLLVFSDDTSLEIFNALDENGVEFHQGDVKGTFEICPL